MATLKPGIITTDFGSYDIARSIVIQKDDKILIAGYSNNGFALARYNSNGSLDTSFDSDGKVTTTVDSGVNQNQKLFVEIQSDGKILVAGTSWNSSTLSNFALVRYNSDGSLDTSFGSNGKVISDLSSGYHDSPFFVSIQADGKILIMGNSADGSHNGNLAFVRYNSNGSFDTSFGSNGKITTQFVNQGVVGGFSGINFSLATEQSDGKILTAGYAYNLESSNYKAFPALMRYNTDGSLDTDFSNDGITTVDTDIYANNVTIQNNKIILLDNNATLVRCNIDGSIDTSFGQNGKAMGISYGIREDSVVLQSDGKILAAGSGNFGLIRYNSDGSIDTNFSDDGMVTTDVDQSDERAYSIAVQADGKILVAGSYSFSTGFYSSDSNFLLIRYNSDGTLDSTFNLPTWQETLTQSGGYYSTFADLSKAAYQLASDETTGQGINYIKPYADEAWARVNANWNVLTSNNLSVNSGTLGTDGIYHNANAAAFAAQCENTLVLSFRGTNDNDGAFLTTSGERTPDVYDWTHMAEHYAKLKPFIDAIDSYVANPNNAIQNVYVTGHSLGGAMVLAYMIDYPKVSSVNYEAVTFAAPSYDYVGVSDNRIISIEMKNDIVPDTGGYHAGHIVTVNSPLYHGNQVNDSTQAYNGTSDYHSMDIYMEAAHALDSQLPDTSINTNTSLHGFNLTSFDGVWEAQVALPMLEATGTQQTWDNAIAPHYVAMTGNNTLSGVGKNIMLGGVGDDSYRVDNQQDIIIEKANSGKDSVSSAISLTLPDNVENLTLQNKTGGISPFNFTQNLKGTGNAQNNILDGNDAKNSLTGLAGNDTLSGAKGNDTLMGGLGKDKLTGGAGADNFKFDTVKDSGLTLATRDLITDFNYAQGDKIDLSGIDANITTKENNNSDAFLTLESGFTDVTFNVTNALYFNKTSHILYGNNDSDAAADFSILLTGVSSLALSDFIL